MNNKSVEIKFEDREVHVYFDGMWSRRDIDSSYRAMLSKLPAHIMELRKGMEAQDGERKGRDKGKRGKA